MDFEQLLCSTLQGTESLENSGGDGLWQWQFMRCTTPGPKLLEQECATCQKVRRDRCILYGHGKKDVADLMLQVAIESPEPQGVKISRKNVALITITSDFAVEDQ